MRTGSGNRTVGRSPGSAESATHAKLAAPSSGIRGSAQEEQGRAPRCRKCCPGSAGHHRAPLQPAKALLHPTPHPLEGFTSSSVPPSSVFPPLLTPSQSLKPSWCSCREPSGCAVAIAVPMAMPRYGRSGKAGALFHPHCAVWGWAGHCCGALVQSLAALLREKKTTQDPAWIVATAIPSAVTHGCHGAPCDVPLHLPEPVPHCVPVPPHGFPQRRKGLRCSGGTAQPDKQVLSCLISQHVFLS